MTQSGTSSSQIFRRSLLDETADAFLRVFRGLQPALSRGYFRPFKHGFSCTGEGRRDRKGSLLANLGCEIDGALALTSRGDHFLNKPQPQGGFGVELLASQEVSQGVGARMPSEWAKRVECWDSLKETRIEPTDPMPQELQSQLKSSGDASEEDVLEPAEGSVTDSGIDSLILRVRPLFGRSEVLTRGELVNKLSEILGCLSGDGKVAEEVEELIRAAERRSILREEDGGYGLVSRTISDYPREVLKDQFIASLNGSDWTERNEAIPRFARWLGFRRTGPNIEDAARSAINGLIRANRLEKMGSQIRRKV